MSFSHITSRGSGPNEIAGQLGVGVQASTAFLKRTKLRAILVDTTTNNSFALAGNPMDERRKSSRTRALKGARIVYGNSSLTRDCAVRNLSANGAKLVMPSTAGIPDRFELLFEDGAQKDCIVRWRKLTDIGIEFIDLA